MAEAPSDQSRGFGDQRRWIVRCTDASGLPRWLANGRSSWGNDELVSDVWDFCPTPAVHVFPSFDKAEHVMGCHKLEGLDKWVEEVDADVWAVTVALHADLLRDGWRPDGPRP